MVTLVHVKPVGDPVMKSINCAACSVAANVGGTGRVNSPDNNPTTVCTVPKILGRVVVDRIDLHCSGVRTAVYLDTHGRHGRPSRSGSRVKPDHHLFSTRNHLTDFVGMPSGDL